MAAVKAGKKAAAAGWISFAVCLIFFLGILYLDGPVLDADSASYIEMDLSREPVYPLYLAALRHLPWPEGLILYGQPAYLTLAAAIACVLNAFAVARITDVTYRYMSRLGRAAGILCAGSMTVLQLAGSILNRFFAIRHSMYAQCILTESLAIPLYTLFCVELWLALHENSRKHMAAAFLLAFLQTNLRKQMTICLIAAVAMSFIVYILRKKSRSGRRFLGHLIIAALIIVLSSGGERVYHYFVHGAAVGRTNDNKALFSNLMYISDEEDALLFAQYDPYGPPEDREIFQKLIRIYDERGLLYKNLKDRGEDLDFYTYQQHYAESYDEIGIIIAMPLIGSYIEEEDPVQRRLIYDQYTDRINAVLIHQPMDEMAEVVFRNVLEGFADTAARYSPVLVPAIIAVYVIYFVLFIAVLTAKKVRSSSRDGALLAAEITMGLILINIAIVGVTIFSQPRYMTYGMGNLYAAILIMFFVLRSRGDASIDSLS